MSASKYDQFETVTARTNCYFFNAEMAFDMVEWQYLKQVLAYMAFGNLFTFWTNLIYTDQFANVDFNESASQKISRGVRQGCPLSHILLNFLIETLATAVHQIEQITSTRIGSMELKLDADVMGVVVFVIHINL